MKILLDLQSCQSGSRLGGIGRYSLELAKEMLLVGGEHEFWVLLSGIMPESIEQIRFELSNLIPQDRIVVFSSIGDVSYISNHPGKVSAAELIRESFIAEINPDLVHVTSLFEGLQEDVITSVGRIFPAEKTVVTLYDLIPFVQRDRYLSNAKTLAHYLRKIEDLKKAGLLLSISEFSKDEAVSVLGVDPEKVINISSAADARFKPQAVGKDLADEILSKYHIDRKFLMYTGSFDQRKNHANLIRAFSLVPSKVRKNYQLVIVGNGWDGIYKELGDVAIENGLTHSDVVFAGRVDDQDLVQLYNLCSLFVFPSLAEGFGLPVLEAMSCGIPTICSNCTSLPEVRGIAKAQFDPRDVNDIARVIKKCLTNPTFMQKLREHGLEHSKKFSWRNSAKTAVKAMESYFEKTSIIEYQNNESANSFSGVANKICEIEGVLEFPDEAIKDLSSSIMLNKVQVDTSFSFLRGGATSVKVGWVTTWNTRCGIASYSRYLIDGFPAINYVFAPRVQLLEYPDATNVYRCWDLVSGDLVGLYREILDKGVEVVVVQFNYGFYDFPRLAWLIDSLCKCRVRVSVTFHSTHDPSDDKRLSLLASSLRKCHSILVHSSSDVKRFKDIGVVENVRFIPQGVALFDEVEIVRRRHYPKTSRVIATYGFALLNKGLMEILKALVLLRKKAPSEDFRLLMINAEYPDPQSRNVISKLRSAISEFGLEDVVTLVTDYLDDSQSLSFLRSADLIVYGYQNTGESSSAAVRMGLSSKVPVAVTPLRIFDDVDGAVFKLPGCEPEDIASGVLDYFGSNKAKKSVRDVISKMADSWRKSHDYKNISRYLYWALCAPRTSEFSYEIKPLFDLGASNKELSFFSNDPSLKTIVGEKNASSIKSTFTSGNLLFGPFVSVESGDYKATIKGFFERGTGVVFADVSAFGSGHGILAEVDLSAAEPRSEGVIGEVIFSVPDGGCRDLEVRINVDSHARLEITSLAISSLGLTGGS